MQPNKQQLEAIWAEVPADYYFRLNRLQRIWHEWKWITIKHLLVKGGIQPKTILEVGCAGGHLSGLLSELFPKAKVTGIDVYEPAIREARARFPKIAFIVADAHTLPFRSNSFDLVICSETIEHVVDPGQTLREMKRVLTKDGSALVEMDSGNWLFRIVWFAWTRFGKGKVWAHAHLHPFTAVELEKVILTSGFKIQQKMFSHFGMAISFLVTKK